MRWLQNKKDKITSFSNNRRNWDPQTLLIGMQNGGAAFKNSLRAIQNVT
jgi:hypothetical protein